MATPVPRGCCVYFWQEPILAKTRAFRRRIGELVCPAAAGPLKFTQHSATGWGKKQKQSRHSEGGTRRGRSKTVSCGRAAPQPCGHVGRARKRGSGRLPGIGKSAHLHAATRSGSAHDYGEDRRIPAPGQLVFAAAG